MAFRAFFALPVESFQTSSGLYTNAVYGFTSMLLKLIETEKPSHVAVAFDLPGGTFRTEEYSEYKAGRDATPEEFKGQISVIQEILTHMGIRSLTKENYEADDILATLAHEGNKAQWRVLVASGDRDSFQMVTDNVTVIYPGASTADLRYMTPEAVEAKYGVVPDRYPELAALVGESADNLPGVPGVGPKTAAQWLAKYDGLENLLAQADKVGGKRGEALREHKDEVRRNRRLNHLLTDLDVGCTINDLQRQPVARADLSALFDILEFNTLRKRVFALDTPVLSSEILPETLAEGRSVFGDDVYGEPLAPLQLAPETLASAAVVDLRTVNVSPLSEDSLAALAAAPADTPIALRVAGAAIPGGGEALALAVCAGTDGYVADLTDLPASLEASLATFLATRPCVVHDGKATWHRLRGAGLPFAQPVFDVQLAAYILQPEQRDYELPGLVEKHLHHVNWRPGTEKTQDALFDMEAEIEGAAHEYDYLAHEAGVILDLLPVLDYALENAGGEALLRDMELPVQTTLSVMEDRGIAIDQTRLDEMSHSLGRDVEKAQQRAWEIIGEEVNLSSPKQLQSVLFETLELPKTKKTKTGYTTNAEALQGLFEKTGHPFLEQLLIHRDRIKLKQMVETLRSCVADDSRIHSTFSQVVAATGRLASSDPNLQNIPARTEDGRRIRHAFVAGQAYDLLMSADYSQIEMRIMAHLSEDQGLIEAFNTGEDLHRTMAAMVFGVPVSDVTGEQRSRIKATSYGLAYGLSAYGLSAQLKISVPEAAALRDRYFQRFGGVQHYLNEVVKQARIDGFTSTMFGRRRYLPDLNADHRQRREVAERAALNAPIQGSAADIIKIAMINVENALNRRGLRSRLLLQIHDELVLEVVQDEQSIVEEIVRAEMAAAAHMSVPLDVAVGVGHSWMEAAH